MATKIIPYMDKNDTSAPVYGLRGEEFKNFIGKFLARGKIKQHYIEILLTDESMKLYDMAFTSPTVNRQSNYEILEQLGDATCNKAFVWYIQSTFFPDISNADNIKIISRMKNFYTSTKMFYAFAEKYGFMKFVSASVDKRHHQLKGLGEDVFEAFIGATEMLLDKNIRQGVGYPICYEIIKSVYDSLIFETKYEKLIDNKSKLKELADKHLDIIVNGERKKIKKVSYVNKGMGPDGMIIADAVLEFEGGNTMVIGTGKGSNIENAQPHAAFSGLQTLMHTYGVYLYTDFTEPTIRFKY